MKYKYHCRPCPKHIRDRCIQQSQQSPSVKIMMRRAFDAGRDSQEMWDRLQMNCLLIRMEEQAAQPRPSSLLGRRLGKQEETSTPSKQAGAVVPPPAVAIPTPDREPVRQTAPVRTKPVTAAREEAPSVRYCLVPEVGDHRIALPREDQIALGRFDSATNVTPDVDLTFDDRENNVISRRHARIIVHGDGHEIEDLGSTNGTRVNGIRLQIGQQVPLRPGDRVALGYCNFVYVPVPDEQVSFGATTPQTYLWATFNGHRFLLPTWGETVVGRSDVSLGLTPDIDLTPVGEAAQVVARRHAQVIARGGRHYLQDLGSASGTKVNGARVTLNEQRLLEPGDHIWLGGCVLAYDIEQKANEEHPG